MDPEEIKLALITDVDRLVQMFFDQAKEQLNREYKKVTLAIQTLKEVQSDIQDYNTYREKSIEAIKSFHTSLLASKYFEQTPQVNEEGEFESKQIKKAKELKEEIEAVVNATDRQDKDIIALGRKIDSSYAVLGVYFPNRYYLSYFKEYVSKVRKTERTLLKPRGYSLTSDLSPVMAQYEAEKQSIQAQAETFKGEQDSPKWAELRLEIQAKKSALQVEGRSAESRAKDFETLNYLLEYRTNLVPAAATEIINTSELELEALALEIELELINF